MPLECIIILLWHGGQCAEGLFCTVGYFTKALPHQLAIGGLCQVLGFSFSFGHWVYNHSLCALKVSFAQKDSLDKFNHTLILVVHSLSGFTSLNWNRYKQLINQITIISTMVARKFSDWILCYFYCYWVYF